MTVNGRRDGSPTSSDCRRRCRSACSGRSRSPTVVDLDFDTYGAGGTFTTSHYAFLVDDAEFDAIFGRIRDGGIDHWADPGRLSPGEINHHDGGRGVYFADPDDHLLEIITVPYGGVAKPV